MMQRPYESFPTRTPCQRLMLVVPEDGAQFPPLQVKSEPCLQLEDEIRAMD